MAKIEMVLGEETTQTLLGKKVETCRTYVDNNSAGWLTLYAKGTKSYAQSATGDLISAYYQSSYYNFAVLKKSRIIVLDVATNLIESDEVLEVNTTFNFYYNNYKEVIAIEE